MTPQVSRTPLSILADLNNAVVWIVPTRSLVPVSIIWWLYQEHQLQLVSPSLSCSIVFSIPKQGPGTYPSFRFLSILLFGQPGQQSPQFGKFSFFYCLLLILVVWPVYISKSQNSLYVSFSWTDSMLCIYHLFVWSNFNFLHNSLRIIPSRSCLV